MLSSVLLSPAANDLAALFCIYNRISTITFCNIANAFKLLSDGSGFDCPLILFKFTQYIIICLLLFI